MSSDQNFSRPGSVDLSGLKQAASQQVSPGGSYVVTVSEANFSDLVQQSARYPVFILVTSSSDPGSSKTASELADIINAQAGSMVLGLVNVDTDPQLAQAFGTQAVPTALALIAGQAAPLFQGTKDAAELQAIVDQIRQMAVANGLTGKAAPASVAEDSDEVDPRFAAADDALARGDFDQAVKEFDKLIEANPRDTEAQAGKAQASLLARTVDATPDLLTAADDNPDDIDAGLAAADLELAAGRTAQAFERLIALIRATADDERERVRSRYVELLSTLPANDPEAKKARQALAMALF